jgi:hypothetical protein
MGHRGLTHSVPGSYASPLHEWFGAYLWPLAPVRWIVVHLDALFG